MSLVRSVITVLLGAGAVLATGAAQAQRMVFVNGQRMTPQQLAILDRIQCVSIPNGSYWLNTSTGAWGYTGNARRQGFVGDLCRTGGQRQRSLSERGLLYTPGDIHMR